METIKDLRLFAEEIRYETLKMLTHLGFGHVGGAMSIVEVIAALYGGIMNIDPKNPKWENRDKLVLSKGHAGPSLYAALALRGFFPMEKLNTLNQGGTMLPSHVNSHLTPGIDCTTGSLGQGISPACGMALGDRIKGRDCYTYFILGDGECNEGQIWEGASFASHFKLDHLIGFVDLNKQQLDGYTWDVLNMGDMVDKFTAFGWETRKVDGHDPYAIAEAIEDAKKIPGKPHMIVLDTVKGHGCVRAENTFPCHHITCTAEEMAESLKAAEEALERAKGGK